MATITFDKATVDHTLPTYYAGVGLARLNTSDFTNSTYRAAFQNLNPEIVRLNPWHGMGTVASPDSNFTNMRSLCAFLGSTVGVWMGTTTAHPNGTPSGVSEASTTNYEGSGAGRSPSDCADWFANFLSNSVNVIGMEAYNEPDNCAGGTPGSYPGDGSGPGDGPWFGPGGSNPSQSDINKCITWAAVIHRQYQAAIASKASALSVSTPKIGGAVLSAAQPYAQGWAKHFASGVSESGAAWPYGDGNWSYFDVLTFHPYQRGGTNQGILNSIYYNPSQATIDSASSIGLSTMSFLDKLHAYFVAQGHSDKKLAYNEYGVNDGGTAFAGIVEVAHAIIGFGWNKTYNIDHFSTWSGNRSTDPVDFAIFPTTSYTLNTKAVALRDLVFYFSRNYKRVVGFGQAGGNTPSSGDSGGNNNSVPRLPWVAGLNATGSSLAILVANIDLTTAESVTFNWTTGSATGNVTGKNLQQSTTTTGSTTLPAITPITPSGTSFTKTIEAGAAYIFEIPLTGTGSAPTNTVAPSISGSLTQGNTLTANPGTWTGSPTFTYQWKRGGTNIASATASTYTTVAADVGTSVTVAVTGTNASGSASATSSGVTITAASGSTLGITSIGGSFASTAHAGYANGLVKFTVPTGKTYTITTGSVYLRGDSGVSGTLNLKGLLFSANGSTGDPGQAVAIALNIVTITGGGSATAAAWASFTFNANLAAGDYWLVVLADSAGQDVVDIAYTAGGYAVFRNLNNYSTITVGSPWGASDGSEAKIWSAYVTFTDATATSFPATTVIDNFNRANGDVGPTSYSVIQGGVVRPVVSSNQVTEGT